jgi:hypothetical protein
MLIKAPPKRALIEHFLPLPWSHLYAMDIVDQSAATLYNSGVLARAATIQGAAKLGVFNTVPYTTFDGDVTTPVKLNVAHAAWQEQQSVQGFTIFMLARLANNSQRMAGYYKAPAGAITKYLDLAYSSTTNARGAVTANGSTQVALQVTNEAAVWHPYIFRFNPGVELKLWGATIATNTTSIPTTLYSDNSNGIAIGGINTSNAFPFIGDLAIVAEGPYMDDATINDLINGCRDYGMA